MGAGGRWVTRLIPPLRLGNASVRTGTGRAVGLAAGPRSEQPGHRPAWSLLQDDELKYTLKRLVEGLGATREAARPGFSLALAQVSVSHCGPEPSAASAHAWGVFCCPTQGWRAPFWLLLCARGREGSHNNRSVFKWCYSALETLMKL